MKLKEVLTGLVRQPNSRQTSFWLARQGSGIDRFVPRETYVEIRLTQMLLRDKRVMWREFIPLASLITELQFAGQRQVVPFVVGPDLLAESLQRDAGDFVEFRDRRVAGPFPYAGDEIVLFTGLARIETQNWARQALSLLGNVAKTFDVSKLTSYVDVAGALTTGLQGLLNMQEVESRIGIDRSFSTPPTAGDVPSHALQPGHHVFINADPAHTGGNAAERFSISDGVLLHEGKEYREADFVVIEFRAEAMRHDHTAFEFHTLHWPKIEDHIINGREDEAWDRFQLLASDLVQCEDLVFRHRDLLLQEYADTVTARIARRREIFRGGGGRRDFQGATIEPLDELRLQDAISQRTASGAENPEQLLASAGRVRG